MSGENNLNNKIWKQNQPDLDPGFHNLFYRITQPATGLECNNLFGWNLDGLSRLGVTAFANRPRIHRKCTKTDQGDLVA